MTSPEIRPATPDDVAGIDAVIRAAFGAEDAGEGDKVADLWVEVRAGLRDPDLAFLEDLFAREFPPD